MSGQPESHVETLLKYTKELEHRNEALGEKLIEAQARIAALQRVQVLVFGSSSRLGVAIVSSSDPQGSHEMALATMAFATRADDLRQKGIGFEVVKSIAVNDFHGDPFKH